jgi:hypothetical protein
MKPNKLEVLLTRQKQLKAEIANHLDILMGSVVKSPSMSGYCLTDKIKGKTVTRYVRKSVVAEAQRMTFECQKLWKRLRSLSQIHWELLKLKASDLQDGSKR